MITCVAPVAKFRDYIFKPGATHGKDHVFRSLGYDQVDAAQLAAIFEQQATDKYALQEFSLGRLDEYGQRINIEIQLDGKGGLSSRKSYIISGWMIQSDGSITLNTPFGGFAR